MNTHLIPARRSRRAFSLIEVLAAMTILAIIVLMVARLFADSSMTWKVGSRRVDQDVNARASLELIGRQLTMAMADHIVALRIQKGDKDIYGNDSDMVSFASLDQRAELRNFKAGTGPAVTTPYRDLQQIRYLLMEPAGTPKVGYMLGRHSTQAENNEFFQCYANPNWTEGFDLYPDDYATVMAEHVARFNIYAYTPNSNGIPVLKRNYFSATDGGLLWIDLVMYVLDEDDAIKAANMSGTERNKFLDRVARRYVHRAFPHNAPGRSVR